VDGERRLLFRGHEDGETDDLQLCSDDRCCRSTPTIHSKHVSADRACTVPTQLETCVVGTVARGSTDEAQGGLPCHTYPGFLYGIRSSSRPLDSSDEIYVCYICYHWGCLAFSRKRSASDTPFLVQVDM
jgi:hypothetical protein